MSDGGEVVLEEITEDNILTFVDGIPGFADCHRFILVDMVEDSAFQFLQGIDDPDVSMIVTVPWIFFPEYAPELSEVEAQELSIESPEDAIVFCPVTLDADNDKLYVNLIAPFVVNVHSRQGRQLVLVDSEFPVRAEIDMSGVE